MEKFTGSNRIYINSDIFFLFLIWSMINKCVILLLFTFKLTKQINWTMKQNPEKHKSILPYHNNFCLLLILDIIIVWRCFQIFSSTTFSYFLFVFCCGIFIVILLLFKYHSTLYSIIVILFPAKSIFSTRFYFLINAICNLYGSLFQHSLSTFPVKIHVCCKGVLLLRLIPLNMLIGKSFLVWLLKNNT